MKITTLQEGMQIELKGEMFNVRVYNDGWVKMYSWNAQFEFDSIDKALNFLNK